MPDAVTPIPATYQHRIQVAAGAGLVTHRPACRLAGMPAPIDLAAVPATFTEPWQPRTAVDTGELTAERRPV